MSHRAWTRVALFFAIVTGATAPLLVRYIHTTAAVGQAVTCTFWVAIWLRRKAKEDAEGRVASK